MTFAKTVAASLGLALLAQSANAADWIEKVSVGKDGIDIVPIEVSANSSGYTGLKTKSHTFGLRLQARATNGERIVALKVGSYHGVLYFEGGQVGWDQSFDNRAVGAGSKRTVDISYSAAIPLAKVAWIGGDPKAKCAANLQAKMAKGTSKATALSKAYTLSAYAYFELDAVAAHKNKAESGKWNLKNTNNQRAGAPYEVTVTCLPGTGGAGS